MTYTVEVDSDLKKPLKVRVAQEETTVKQWVSEVIRQALLTDSDRPQNKAA